MSQQPSLGRVVLYCPDANDAEVWVLPGPFAARVSHVEANGNVHLHCDIPGLGVVERPDVPFGGPGVPNSWSWPPRV